jgi:hypothetical protein
MSRIRGQSKRVLELSSALDFNYAYTLLSRIDALSLGYPEADNRPEDYEAIRADRVPSVLGLRGIEIGILVTLKEVSIGNLIAKDVDAVVLKIEAPRMFPVDVILGWSFLKNFKLTFDLKSGCLTLDNPK